MAKARDITNQDGEVVGKIIKCPGCGFSHCFYVEKELPSVGKWKWNGSYDKPTFQPSMLCKHGTGFSQVCHSFVTDGRIQFLADSTHHLSGQTVDLPDAD